MSHELINWGALAPLRLRAKEVSSGLYFGHHRSQHRGAGVEFDSHRDYVPGDDLRRLDYRALVRHERLLVRQFETETDRRLCFLVDATKSMAYASTKAKASKLAYAGLLVAALTRIASATGDLITLDWLGGRHLDGNSMAGLSATAGKLAFERVVEAFEQLRTSEDETADAAQSSLTAPNFERQLYAVAKAARRGSVIVLLSDLIDLPDIAAAEFATLGNRQRSTVVVRILDPVEANFSFRGVVRLKSSTGDRIVETDAGVARAGYLQALGDVSNQWRSALVAHNGRLVECTTDDDPVDVLRAILSLNPQPTSASPLAQS
jgi:uncharacterized protein (DUF58 family)